MARIAPAIHLHSRHPWRSDGEVQLSPQRKSAAKQDARAENTERPFFLRIPNIMRVAKKRI